MAEDALLEDDGIGCRLNVTLANESFSVVVCGWPRVSMDQLLRLVANADVVTVRDLRDGRMLSGPDHEYIAKGSSTLATCVASGRSMQIKMLRLAICFDSGGLDFIDALLLAAGQKFGRQG